MNRYYSVPEAIHELDGAMDLVGNVNVDTMYGFEGEPDDALLKTLKAFHNRLCNAFGVSRRAAARRAEDLGCASRP